MKRRVAPRLLLLCAAAAAASAASWLEEHSLVVRRDMEHALNSVSSGEFAPPSPHEARRRLKDRKGGKGERDEGCSSPMVKWTTQQVRDMSYKSYKTLHENKILSMAYVYKHYVDRNDGEEFFVNDAQTEELRRRHRDAIAFWSAADVDGTLITDDVLLLSMHGSDLEDSAKLVPTILRMFDYSDMSDVLAFASEVQGLVSALPGGYDNPLLTMNAVATRSTYDYGTFGGHADHTRRHKDSIIIGDGVLKFVYDSGLGSSGPDFVYAHELGHHLQFQMVDNLRSSNHAGISADAIHSFKDDDRKKELMADAIGAYFLTHELGGGMVEREIEVFDQTAFSTGDCGVNDEDHHGTPEQRRCAALWGASTAATGMDGHGHVPILDAEVFVGGFVRAYGGMLGLDPGVCALVLEETSADEALADYASQWYTEEVAGNGNGPQGSGGGSSVDLNSWLDQNGNDNYADETSADHTSQWYTEEVAGNGNGPQGSAAGSSVDLNSWLDKNGNDNYWENDNDGGGSGIDLNNWLDGNGDDNYRENENGEVDGQGYTDGVQAGIEEPGDVQDWLDSIKQHNDKWAWDHHIPPLDNEMRGGADPAEAGAPATPAHMKNAVTIRNCNMPWVHCHESSGFAALGRPLCTVSVLTASALVALF